MKRSQCCEGQIHLWPDEVMNSLAGHPKLQEPLPPLPFERNEEIDLARCAKILAVNEKTVRRLVRAKEISGYQIRSGEKSKPVLRISKDSVLTFCDGLRLKYLIQPRKASVGRWPKDDDFLPFPWAETIDLSVVMEKLDVSRASAIKLIDSGDITAYQLWAKSQTRYRVHRPSFVAYLKSLHTQAALRS